MLQVVGVNVSCNFLRVTYEYLKVLYILNVEQNTFPMIYIIVLDQYCTKGLSEQNDSS